MCDARTARSVLAWRVSGDNRAACRAPPVPLPSPPRTPRTSVPCPPPGGDTDTAGLRSPSRRREFAPDSRSLFDSAECTSGGNSRATHIVIFTAIITAFLVSFNLHSARVGYCYCNWTKQGGA